MAAAGVETGVGVRTGVGVKVGLGVAVGFGVEVGVTLGVEVGAGVGVEIGVGVEVNESPYIVESNINPLLPPLSCAFMAITFSPGLRYGRMLYVSAYFQIDVIDPASLPTKFPLTYR